MTQDTGLGIDNETGRITRIDSEQMSSNLEPREETEYRCFLFEKDYFERCTDLFFQSTATGSLASSGAPRAPISQDASMPTMQSGGISSGSKRAATQTSTEFEVGSSSRPKQKMSRAERRRAEMAEFLNMSRDQNATQLQQAAQGLGVNNIPSQEECFDLVKNMPNIDAHMRVQIGREFKSISERRMFLCFSEEDRMLWAEQFRQ